MILFENLSLSYQSFFRLRSHFGLPYERLGMLSNIWFDRIRQHRWLLFGQLIHLDVLRYLPYVELSVRRKRRSSGGHRSASTSACRRVHDLSMRSIALAMLETRVETLAAHV